MTFPIAKKSLLDRLRGARPLCFLMIWLCLSNIIFATLCSAHDVAHALQPDAVHATMIDQTPPGADLDHAVGTPDSHCMHSTGVHAPCIACVATVSILMPNRHSCNTGNFSAPPSRPSDELIRPPSFN